MEFNGMLNTNKVFGALFNMIISQTVFSDNIKKIAGSNLLEMSKVDSNLYGDTRLYYSTDVLHTREFLGDSESSNLLQINRPKAPKVQKIVLDNFRQIDITTDTFLSKQAFSTEGAFSQFNSTILQWLNDTKRIHMTTMLNQYIGATETNIGKQTQEIQLQKVEGDIEATNKLEATAIAEKIANILVDLTDISRDYNDYGYLRSYDAGELVVIWNSEYYNKIKKTELPLFFKQDFIDKFSNEDVLPSRYFGKMNTMEVTQTDGLTIRSAKEQIINGVNYFAGDLLPEGITLVDEVKILYPTYTEDSTIVCKIIHKDSTPLMGNIEIGTNFFNARSLTTNSYISFAYSTLDYLKNYPFITLRAKAQ